MARQRSPNYPSIDLATAVTDAKALYDKEGRTAVAPEVAVKAWKYKSLSGPSRSRLAALRHFGLVQLQKGTVTTTDRALTLILRSPSSPEWRDAVRAAALDPDIFNELYHSHLEASDDALKHHLVVERRFTDDGARRLAESFRATLRFAGLDKVRYNGGAGEETNEEEEMDNDQQDEGHGTGSRVYRYQLSKNVLAEVKLMGDDVGARELQMLRKYLELAEQALETSS